jgi:hypothetical protein
MKALHVGREGSMPKRYVCSKNGEKLKVYFGYWCSRIWRARSFGPGPSERIAVMVDGCCIIVGELDANVSVELG